MHTQEIKPGMPLDIVFENEFNQPHAHYMKAVVYDCNKKFITISQTSPALNKNFLKRRVLATFLVFHKSRALRFGFSAYLTDLIGDYEISSQKTVEALLLKKLNEQEPVDFRMYFRVQPPSDTSLHLYHKEEKVNLLDISIGGAKFIHPKRHVFQRNDKVSFKLIIAADAVFNIDAVVRNVQEPDINATNRNIQYVSVEFRPNDRKMETSLGKAIMDIERSLLSKGRI
jgi:hypothetical protein